jgi:CBS domain-containing protein
MAHKVKRLPVIDAGGRLVGMIGRAAVLNALGRGAGTPPV